MTSVFFFYLSRTAKNRLRARLSRLRQPKYLISLLAGFLYVYSVFLHPMIIGRGGRPRSEVPNAPGLDWLAVAEVGFSVLLLCLVLLPWIFPYRRGGIVFTEAEIQFLFPAPLTRRSLLHLRILKGQIAILFGVIVSYIIFGRGRSVSHPLYLVIDLWLVYSFLALYRMGTSLVQTSLAQHRVSGFRRQVWVLAVVVIMLLSVAAWLKWLVPTPPSLQDVSPSSILEWVTRAVQSGPAYYLLLPFRTLIRPALASDLKAFVARTIPAIVLLFLTYLWVVRSDFAFEEASLERSERTARRLDAVRRGAPGPAGIREKRLQRPLFELSARGFPFVALFWKNLLSAVRSGPRRVLPFLIALGVILAVSSASGSRSGDNLVFMLVGSVAAALAGIACIVGPLALRDDLRTDLSYLESIKTYPIPGWGVVLGEVMAPTAVLAAVQWALLLVAVLFLPAEPHPLLAPYSRIMFALAAAVLLPCLSFFGVLIQNAAVLLVPGWVHIGKEHQQGIEAIGQRLLTAIANAVALMIAVIPGAVAFAVVSLSGYWLLGMAVIPLAALIAAAGLLFEAALLLVWLGRLFDRLDASAEIQLGAR